MTQLTLCELADPGIEGLESYSPFCLKVHRALRAAGLPYRRRHGAHPRAFLELDRAGQVPILLVGDEVIADSTRIVARISQLGRSLYPSEGPSLRAEALLTEELADTGINAYVVAARWADERNWPAVRAAYFGALPVVLRSIVASRARASTIAAVDARGVWRRGHDDCWRGFRDLLDQLDARAPREGFWLGTERPCVADVALFGQLQSFRTQLTPWQREQVEDRAALRDYLDRVDRATAGTAPAAEMDAAA